MSNTIIYLHTVILFQIFQVPYLTAYKTHPNFNKANQEKKLIILNIDSILNRNRNIKYQYNEYYQWLDF